MSKSAIPDSETQSLAAAQSLWTLLTATSGVNNELERARLTATGLPSLLPCHVSGVALLDEPEKKWSLVLQKDGLQVAPPDAGKTCKKLTPLFEKALHRSAPLVVRVDEETDRSILEFMDRCTVKSLVVTPLITLRARLGVLLIGRKSSESLSKGDGFVLLTLAEHSAIGIEILRLSQNLRKAHDELELRVEQRTAELSKALSEVRELKNKLEAENLYLQEEIKTQQNFEEIIGESPSIKKALKAVETVAPTNATVLITGETGTGKELIARAVHNLSPRRDKTLIRVNCAAIPRELFESEFFGHVRGAFTGALKDRLGRFQLADGGTLFLDEVGEIPMELQSKLLRVLQEGEFERIGDEITRKVDVRIIAASNRDLRKEIQAGRFREDLYFRLSVFPIEIPPLRERVEDIPNLAVHFQQQGCRRLGISEIPLKQRHVVQLQTYPWPGNVRELQNIVERAIIASNSGTLNFDIPSLGVAPRSSAQPTPPITYTPIMTFAELKLRERENVLAALEQTNWKISGPGGAAELLGVKVPTLVSRIKALSLKNPKA